MAISVIRHHALQMLGLAVLLGLLLLALACEPAERAAPVATECSVHWASKDDIPVETCWGVSGRYP